MKCEIPHTRLWSHSFYPLTCSSNQIHKFIPSNQPKRDESRMNLISTHSLNMVWDNKSRLLHTNAVQTNNPTANIIMIHSSKMSYTMTWKEKQSPHLQITVFLLHCGVTPVHLFQVWIIIALAKRSTTLHWFAYWDVQPEIKIFFTYTPL